MYKYGFSKSPKNYFVKWLTHLVVIVIVYVITHFCANSVADNSIIGFMMKLIIVLVLHNAFIILFYHKTKEFAYVKNSGKRLYGALKNELNTRRGENK